MDLIHMCTKGPKSMGGRTKKWLNQIEKYLVFGMQQVFL